MDVFKGAAFKPPLRTSEEEYSLCSTALELDAPNRLQYSLYKRKSASRRLKAWINIISHRRNLAPIVHECPLRRKKECP